MLNDLTPEKDGVLHVNMEDDVIRGATVVHQGGNHLSAAATKSSGDWKANTNYKPHLN